MVKGIGVDDVSVWSGQGVYVTICDENSASIIESEITDSTEYFVGGYLFIPYISFNSFSTQSSTCQIESYSLHSSSSSSEPHPSFYSNYQLTQ